MDLLYVMYALGGLVAIIILWMVYFEVRLRKLFKGSEGKDIEGVLVGIKRDLESLNGKNNKIEDYIRDAEPRLKKSIKNVGVIRFDSFHGAGGGQSFAIALLDENKNGIVLSSMYGRDTNRVYAKPIEGGISSYKLSEEEDEAIQKAITS